MSSEERRGRIDYVQVARALDMKKRPVEALWAYELAIIDSTDIEVFLDLVAIYFKLCDPGFAAHFAVDQLTFDAAYDRAVEVLGIARSRLGPHAEIDFWAIYLRDRVLGEDVPDATYLQLATEGKTPMGFLALYANSNGAAYADEVRGSLSACAQRRTTRERYVSSLAGC